MTLHSCTQTPCKSRANGGRSLLPPRSCLRPRPPPFDPRRFRLETWLGAAILARGEAAEAPVRGSRSGAARAPLLWAAARAPAEPERGAPHLRPHHGKRRAGFARHVLAGWAGTAVAAPGALPTARALARPPGVRERAAAPTRPPLAAPPRPPATPTHPGWWLSRGPSVLTSCRFLASSGSARLGLSAASRPLVTTSSQSFLIFCFVFLIERGK